MTSLAGDLPGSIPLPLDALIIGAGIAGAAASLRLARTLGPNARIALVERGRWPRPKVCGGCLNHAALALLNRLQEATGGAVEAFEYMPDTYMARLRKYRPDPTVPQSGAAPVNILVEVGATSPRDATPDSEGRIPVVDLLEEVLGTMLAGGEITDAVIAQTQAQRRQMWEIREAAAEITLNQHPMVDTDIAVPLDKVETFLSRMAARLKDLDPEATDVVVSHLGDGNVHYTAFPTRDDPALLDAIREAVDDVVVGLHGSFSAEHGIGLSKLGSMRSRKDPVALDLMRRLKHAFDPSGILNPGKTIP